MSQDNQQTTHCDFCRRKSSEVEKMIAGYGVYICNGCIKDSIDLLYDSQQNNLAIDNDNEAVTELSEVRHTPKALVSFLDDYVIGQHLAKKTLAVAVYNHYKRLHYAESDGDGDYTELDKSNILLLGPTGSGKTLLAKTLARILDVPFTIADATTLTEAGYVGDDVENVIKSLLQQCDFDKHKAERGIIFIDEIDKISRRSDNPSLTRDVSGEGVQQALLKIIEGTVASVPPQGGRKHPQQTTIDVDTTNILFICGGAFDGLDKIIRHRLERNSSIGFGADLKGTANNKNTHLLAQVEPDDLIKYGLIPELVGRLPICTQLNELDEKALIEILTKPKNAVVRQFQAFFAMENVKLEFKKSALKAIAQLSIKRKTGARGLRAILESLLLDLMYELPNKKNITHIIIDDAVVLKKQKPLILYRTAKKSKRLAG